MHQSLRGGIVGALIYYYFADASTICDASMHDSGPCWGLLCRLRGSFLVRKSDTQTVAPGTYFTLVRHPARSSTYR